MELYNKYRPQTTEEIMGNDIAIKSVESELKNGSHVFLFTGNGGCGKTTTARVFAKQLGATDLSIHELNSSENRGIDTVREIMEQVRYSPLDNSKVVYILDEMHQQTSAAQNALLKVLEECPEYVYFFLCTTDPQKLIKPLLTRCSRVELKPLDHNTMFMLLRRTAHKEGVAVDLNVLHRIADLSEGSSRKGLKILGSVLFLENDEERNKMLDTNSVSDENQDVIELCRAMISNKGWNAYIECLEKAKDDVNSNPESIRQLVMSYMTSVLKKGINPVAVAALQAFSNCDTFKNGKYAIYVGLLDFISLLG